MADTTIIEINGKYYETASVNRRLLAAVLDIMIIFFILTPVTNFLYYLLLGNIDIQMIAAKYSASRGEAQHGAGIATILDYLFFAYQEGLLQKWLVMQLMTFCLLGAIMVGFWIYKGATIGKMITKCQILDLHSGSIPKPMKCMVRYISYILSALPIGIGFFAIQFSKRNQGFHDMVANTVVIKKGKM